MFPNLLRFLVSITITFCDHNFLKHDLKWHFRVKKFVHFKTITYLRSKSEDIEYVSFCETIRVNLIFCRKNR